jgi:hypothetical protein
LKYELVELKKIAMLLTRQQIKAKKRNAQRLAQLLKDARRELEQSLTVIEDTVIEQGFWGTADISCSQDAHSVIGQILAIADKWHQCNHFEIEEKLSQIEKEFYPD